MTHTITENTRAAFSYEGLNFVKRSGKGIPPKNIFFLSADAFGLLPPISKLTEEQAGIYFLLGYTAKVAGTEEGLSMEPRKTFSTCFAAPFLPLLPRVYARMLKEKISRYQSNVWLVNTGWTGGPYGIGQRISLAYTRNLIHAVLNGSLTSGKFEVDPYFGLNIPAFCENVPHEILNPINTWKDKKGYTRQATILNQSFLDTYAQMA